MVNVQRNTTNYYDIVIIGSGPAGLSAAARAAFYHENTTHLLLEAFHTQSKTIHDYQKRKFVMAEPSFLNLRSEMKFSAGSREEILQEWLIDSDRLNLNIRYDAVVSSITGEQNNFEITLNNGDIVSAKNIVLAIGCQGNPRQVGVKGDHNSNFVRYTLSDPDEFEGKVIVVIGAGDAAIENAMALSKHNQVYIVNRRNEFSRAKEGNLTQILTAINHAQTTLDSYYSTTISAINLPEQDDSMGVLVLNTPQGEVRVECHHIIARLGAIAPRQLVESFGVKFPNNNLDALPLLNEHYQSSVRGLYIIGALGGFPLIKQAMNQGYDVIEHIKGHQIKAADYPLLAGQFSQLPYVLDAEDILSLYQKRVPMFKQMTVLTFRELIIESDIARSSKDVALLALKKTTRHETNIVKSGLPLYEQGEYGSTFYTLIEGSVTLIDTDGLETQLRAGQFFGENSLLSGHPHDNSAFINDETIVIATPRRIMIKLINSNDVIGDGIDRMFVKRLVIKTFKPQLEPQQLDDIVSSLVTKTLNATDQLFKHGDNGDLVYLIRSGTVSLVNHDSGEGIICAQQTAGELVGQLVMMGSPTYQEDAIAAVKSSVLLITREVFLTLVNSTPKHIATLQSEASKLLIQQNLLSSSNRDSKSLAFLLDQGIGEATNAMIIKRSLCIDCNNCETACAATHGGVSRLNRQVGAIQADIHIPNACQHCQEPHCMKDCPTNAINRSSQGEVSIDDKCIGCGNCANNCPYDAIVMGNVVEKQPGLWSKLLLGRSDTPKLDNTGQKKALKCDACSTIKSGPACVSACPTGAAIRVHPDQLITMLSVT
jgi:Fe-S-cluster-containing hydrogenase component 2/thioredoxin reductase/CRP-like cAMP-binding protein